MLAGTGFATVFLYSLIISLIQLRIIQFRKEQIICRLPERIISADESPELGFEVQKGFPVLPGCAVRVSLDFHWHSRRFSRDSAYHSGMRHGTVSLDGLRRGAYSSSGISLLVSDAAGLFRFSYGAGTGGRLNVGPAARVTKSRPVIPGTGGDDISRVIRKKRSDELTEIRQYYPGDDVRRINWRTYAHTGQLFIRLGEEMPQPESHLLIIIDLSGAVSSGLKPAQLDSYLELIIENAAGLFERLNDAGIIVDCIVPPGKTVVSGDPSALVPLWWNDSVISPGLYRKKSNGSCLLICPAFSANAAGICTDAAAAGLRVSMMIPLPEPEKVSGAGSLFHKFIFRPVEKDSGYRSLSPQADALIGELRGRKGVVSVETV